MLHEYDCCVCERQFQSSPHTYEGKLIPGWHGLMVCRRCDELNRDGVVPGTHPHLVSRLESLGIKLKPNDRGWITLPGIGLN